MPRLKRYHPPYQTEDGEPRRKRRHGDGDWPVSLAMRRQAGTAVSHADYIYISEHTGAASPHDMSEQRACVQKSQLTKFALAVAERRSFDQSDRHHGGAAK
ncbi:hypothetical protein P3342_009696 [Pyrenophora teres f. teres]|nr:hypothetical protein P3342_009696 [Pyrenophora teres f. teres]